MEEEEPIKGSRLDLQSIHPRDGMEGSLSSPRWDANSSKSSPIFGQEDGIGQHFVGGENEMGLGVGEGGLYRSCEEGVRWRVG